MTRPTREIRGPFRVAVWIVTLLLAPVLAGQAGAQVMDDHIYWMVMADELEYAPGLEGRPIALDASFWIGGDYDRLWVKLEGGGATLEREGEIEVQGLYGRLITPFFEAQAGLGLETAYGETDSRSRGLLVLGLQGLAPYWFEIEPQLMVSHEGDVAFAFDASYELLFTQRLILEPELELKAAVQNVPEFGIGSGLNDLSFGGRMRYEVARELAPYVGLVWHWRFGETADLARAAGEDVATVRLVAGLRVWY